MWKKEITKKLKKIFEFLYTPTKWFETKAKISNKIFACVIITFLSIGIALNHYYDFPYFTIYFCIFFSIGIIALKSIFSYVKYMTKIVTSIANQKVAQHANIFYYKHIYKNILYIISSCGVMVIFGYGGCIMLGAISINPIFIWIMILFSVAVYVSIIGYVQYIFLAIYIFKLTEDKYGFSNLQHSIQECIPADIEWVKNIAKLSHLYRTAFFAIGSLYIIAFGAFCRLPEFKANCNTPAFYIMWGIIFIAIVLTFPVISILEYSWIKKIVKKIKDTYILDIKKETKYMKIGSPKNKGTQIQIFFLENIYAIRIMESRDYPTISILNTGYSICLSLFNFYATIITVVKETPTVLVDLLQKL